MLKLLVLLLWRDMFCRVIRSPSPITASCFSPLTSSSLVDSATFFFSSETVSGFAFGFSTSTTFYSYGDLASFGSLTELPALTSLIA